MCPARLACGWWPVTIPGHGYGVAAGRRHRPVCASAGLQNISAPAPVHCRCAVVAIPVADSARNTPPTGRLRSPGSITRPAAGCVNAGRLAEFVAASAASHRHFEGLVAGLPATTYAPGG